MRRSRSSEDSGDIDMTPMLDVVFILLIFFIVTSSIEKTKIFDVTLPTASQSEVGDTKNLSFEIDVDELVTYQGQKYTIDESFNILLQNSGGIDTLILYADKDLRTEVFVKLADFAKSNGYSQVALATKEGDR